MPAIPVDIWLLVFDAIDDLDALWSVVRNVSHHFRGCVDEWFRHGVIQSTLVGLHYSTINRCSGPVFQYARLPMQFTSLSGDGARATFRQVAYETQSGSSTNGSVGGWVPFIKRYCEETLQQKPHVLNKGNIAQGPPVWEKEHASMRDTVAGHNKTSYFVTLRDHTSLGRGDRPPYYLKMRDHVHDTELVDLVIDCSAREISFDWRRTFSAFFMEQHFLALAEGNTSNRKPAHDENLRLLALRMRDQGYTREGTSDERRVRRKRLRSWVDKNKHRMTHEHRLLTEDRIEVEKENVRRYLLRDNLRDLHDEDLDSDEYVPEHCADDHPEILLWPWGGDDSVFTSKRRFRRLANRCTVL